MHEIAGRRFPVNAVRLRLVRDGSVGELPASIGLSGEVHLDYDPVRTKCVGATARAASLHARTADEKNAGESGTDAAHKRLHGVYLPFFFRLRGRLYVIDSSCLFFFSSFVNSLDDGYVCFFNLSLHIFDVHIRNSTMRLFLC